MRNKIEIEDKEEGKIGGELDGTLSQFIRAGPRKLSRQTSLWATLQLPTRRPRVADIQIDNLDAGWARST